MRASHTSDHIHVACAPEAEVTVEVFTSKVAMFTPRASKPVLTPTDFPKEHGPTGGICNEEKLGAA